MTQLALAIFSLSSLWLAMGKDTQHQRWAPLVGLAGQPAWLWYSLDAKAWGLLAISLAYSAVYARGAWVQWR